MRERLAAIDRDAVEQRRGRGHGHHRGERRLHRRPRMFRGPTRPVRLDVVESCAGAEVHGDGDTMAIDLRAVPVPRCVQRDRAADAEVRPEDRAAQANVDAAVDPDRQFDVLSDTRQLAGKVVAVQQERRERRRRLRRSCVRGAWRCRSRRRRCRSSAATGRRWREPRALADRSPVVVVTMKSPFVDVARATSSTRRPDSSVAPTRPVSRSSASSTSRDRLVSGNSLPPASS